MIMRAGNYELRPRFEAFHFGCLSFGPEPLVIVCPFEVWDWYGFLACKFYALWQHRVVACAGVLPRCYYINFNLV